MASASSTLSPPAAHGAAGSGGRSGPGLLVLLVATFMTALDLFIVNVAIPAVQSDLHTNAASIQWVVAGFGLAVATGLITAGRLGDIFGRRRIFTVGLALFTLTSAACGVAPTAGTLVAARVLQGLSAAMMSPQVLAILQSAYTGKAQARAFGLYGMTLGVGAVFGQLIGGLLIRADVLGVGWRACFLINVPIGLVALAAAPRVLAESRAPRRPRLDNTGVALSTSAVLALVLPLIQGRAQGWPLWTWLSLAGSAALGTAFVAHQGRLGRRGGDPVLNTALFRQRGFAPGACAQLVFWTGQGSFFLVLALYLQAGRGLSALESGTVFLSIGGGYLLTSTAAHRIAARMGAATVPAGALLMAAGLGGLWAAVHASGTTGSLWELVPGLAVDGVGMGMVIAPLTHTALGTVPQELVGSASGAVATIQQIGGALGIALIGIVFYDAAGDGSPARFPHAFDMGLAFLLALELVLAALTATLAVRGRK
ncbi:drug resistance transporter, EmrB/QacA subfamily [Actinacidiphila yanglinensis]|uniref:Drug resistance transporter, EmrB/QacA subfamily n=1 Tax=Actinacidiphila yanglinensis TaxID=310779 RepID=A0A1H6CX20_9ACTN|nr:MFS transporter [Actinacidiphila yanglinensis]SEG77570.1 drug resistance transporter, EmrB/QacA subfamily [Actinacidiphila yanglinensis]